jgi:hypothetical protein
VKPVRCSPSPRASDICRLPQAKKARAASDSPCDAGARITEGPCSKCDRIGLGDGSSRLPQGRGCQAAAIRLRPDGRGLEQRQSCRRSPGSGMPLTHAPANRAWRALSREPGDRTGRAPGRDEARRFPGRMEPYGRRLVCRNAASTECFAASPELFASSNGPLSPTIPEP